MPRTNYTIDLTGTIYNRHGVELKSDYTQQGRRNTRIYYKPRQIVRTLYHKRRRKRMYKVVSNARTMVEQVFVIPFSYKILYIDGDKSNTSLTNLIIKDTLKYYNTNTYEPTYICLEDYMEEIMYRYELYKQHPIMFQKIVISL